MADYLPVFQGVLPFTATASATVVGGQVLEVTTTGAVGPAAAGSVKAVGVAGHDAAAGAKVTVHPIVGNVHETVSTAGSAAGDCLVTAAAGAVATSAAGAAATAGTDIGVALTTATAGNKVRWIGR